MPSILVMLTGDNGADMTASEPSRICCLSSNLSKHLSRSRNPKGTGNRVLVHGKLHFRLGQQKRSVVPLSGDALSEKVTTGRIHCNYTGSEQRK